jgi:hypothetical protein
VWTWIGFQAYRVATNRAPLSSVCDSRCGLTVGRANIPACGMERGLSICLSVFYTGQYFLQPSIRSASADMGSGEDCHRRPLELKLAGPRQDALIRDRPCPSGAHTSVEAVAVRETGMAWSWSSGLPRAILGARPTSNEESVQHSIVPGWGKGFNEAASRADTQRRWEKHGVGSARLTYLVKCGVASSLELCYRCGQGWI